MRSIKKIAKPEDTPHTFTDIGSGEEIENPEVVLLEGIDKRHKKRKENRRYYGIGDRRKKQQKQHKLNVRIKSGEMPPPAQVWHHPDLEEENVSEEIGRVAKRQNKIVKRGTQRPIIQEKRRPVR